MRGSAPSTSTKKMTSSTLTNTAGRGRATAATAVPDSRPSGSRLSLRRAGQKTNTPSPCPFRAPTSSAQPQQKRSEPQSEKTAAVPCAETALRKELELYKALLLESVRDGERWRRESARLRAELHRLQGHSKHPIFSPHEETTIKKTEEELLLGLSPFNIRHPADVKDSGSAPNSTTSANHEPHRKHLQHQRPLTPPVRQRRRSSSASLFASGRRVGADTGRSDHPQHRRRTRKTGKAAVKDDEVRVVVRRLTVKERNRGQRRRWDPMEEEHESKKEDSLGRTVSTASGSSACRSPDMPGPVAERMFRAAKQLGTTHWDPSPSAAARGMRYPPISLPLRQLHLTTTTSSCSSTAPHDDISSDPQGYHKSGVRGGESCCTTLLPEPVIPHCMRHLLVPGDSSAANREEAGQEMPPAAVAVVEDLLEKLRRLEATPAFQNHSEDSSAIHITGDNSSILHECVPLVASGMSDANSSAESGNTQPLDSRQPMSSREYSTSLEWCANKDQEEEEEYLHISGYSHSCSSLYEEHSIKRFSRAAGGHPATSTSTSRKNTITTSISEGGTSSGDELFGREEMDSPQRISVGFLEGSSTILTTLASTPSSMPRTPLSVAADSRVMARKARTRTERRDSCSDDRKGQPEACRVPSASLFPCSGYADSSDETLRNRRQQNTRTTTSSLDAIITRRETEPYDDGALARRCTSRLLPTRMTRSGVAFPSTASSLCDSSSYASSSSVGFEEEESCREHGGQRLIHIDDEEDLDDEMDAQDHSALLRQKQEKQELFAQQLEQRYLTLYPNTCAGEHTPKRVMDLVESSLSERVERLAVAVQRCAEAKPHERLSSERGEWNHDEARRNTVRWRSGATSAEGTQRETGPLFTLKPSGDSFHVRPEGEPLTSAPPTVPRDTATTLCHSLGVETTENSKSPRSAAQNETEEYECWKQAMERRLQSEVTQRQQGRNPPYFHD